MRALSEGWRLIAATVITTSRRSPTTAISSAANAEGYLTWRYRLALEPQRHPDSAWTA